MNIDTNNVGITALLLVSICSFLGVSCSTVPDQSGSGTTTGPSSTTSTTTTTTVPSYPMIVKFVGIGLNRVDPKKWNGWDGALEDCEYDVIDAKNRFDKLGVAKSVLLLTQAATIENCKNTLKNYIQDMKKGDLLIVWVSGHGGTIADNSGDEADRVDEYICAYDGPILDDTINKWLDSVPEGVRILWICDTCHSGTMYKNVPVVFSVKAIPKGFKGELILLAGTTEQGYSMSTGKGGAWSNALKATGPKGVSIKEWFNKAYKLINKKEQVPVYAEYGNVSDEFRHKIFFE